MTDRTAETVTRLRATAGVLDAVAHDRAMAADVAQIRAAVTDLANQIRALVDAVERRSMPPGSCTIGWGVCPDHGATLVTSRGRSRCTVCGTTWDYDRENQHCREPATFLFHTAPVCRAHAEAAPDHSRITPIEGTA
ncbi:MAG: hypothetical protein HYR62_01825 [Actinobacteria bacterium]|nr:hypothetical protein [Actinomycetota bacterium]MBI3687221.1 hypothetical protein [Actinomycetota bacterium]